MPSNHRGCAGQPHNELPWFSSKLITRAERSGSPHEELSISFSRRPHSSLSPVCLRRAEIPLTKVHHAFLLRDEIPINPHFGLRLSIPLTLHACFLLITVGLATGCGMWRYRNATLSERRPMPQPHRQYAQWDGDADKYQKELSS